MNDISKKYVNYIKNKKDFIKYINKNLYKKFDIINKGFLPDNKKIKYIDIKLLETQNNNIVIYYEETSQNDYKQLIYKIIY